MAGNPLLCGAQPVSTNHVQLPVDGEVLDVLTVEPTADGVRPTILMISEFRGLVPYMMDVIEALAEAGFRVVAPDLLSRIGGTGAYASDPTSVSTRQIESATHLRDLIDVYDWAADDTTAMAVVGFCFGAELGWQLITERSPERAVLYYGIGPDPSAVGRIQSAVYAVYAQDDPRVNDTFPGLGDALMGIDSELMIESYPGTKHAFHDHTRRERYHPTAAAALWQRTLMFLGAAGTGA